jgi:hypothetical protein
MLESDNPLLSPGRPPHMPRRTIPAVGGQERRSRLTMGQTRHRFLPLSFAVRHARGTHAMAVFVRRRRPTITRPGLSGCGRWQDVAERVQWVVHAHVCPIIATLCDTHGLSEPA